MQITMAEVAGFISTALVWQIAGAGKGRPPKGALMPNAASWDCAEYAQDCHPNRMERRSGECSCYALCRSDTGIFIFKRDDHYEEDTVYYFGEGT